MNTNTPSEKSEEEKFNEDFLKIAFPDWMRSTKESHDFRGFVIDKHTILENLLDLLIAAYFFDTATSEKSESFRNNVLANMDFARKVKVVENLGLIDKEIRGLAFKVNDYRLAQAHIKKNDPLREPSKENWDIFGRISTEAHSKLASKIMMTDIDLKRRVAKVVEQKLG
jgi:hypothetical protein